MELALTNESAENLNLIRVTPDVLREIATRLELSAQNANMKQYVLVPLTQNIILCHYVESQTAQKAPASTVETGDHSLDSH